MSSKNIQTANEPRCYAKFFNYVPPDFMSHELKILLVQNTQGMWVVIQLGNKEEVGFGK